VRIEFAVSTGQEGYYAFEVGARSQTGFFVKSEECRLGTAKFKVQEGVVKTSTEIAKPAHTEDRLYLVAMSGFPSFRPVYDLLSSMGFYNLNPDQIRNLQPPDKGELLARDGRNLASVLSRISKSPNAAVKSRIEEYLRAIVPGIEGVDQKSYGHMETLEFRQSVEGSKDPWRFQAISMSDGTLRALGILAALFQARIHDDIPVVGIEEPEVALHPAAASLLRDALKEASKFVQVVVTSHSPELLDDNGIQDDQILAISNVQGNTKIGGLAEASRSALRESLFTVGELLRQNQLEPDVESIPTAKQLNLFGDEAEES
jgi:predicted ATPase